MLLSDLHLDHNELKLGIAMDQAVAKFVKNRNVSAAIVAGDVSSNYLDSMRMIEIMQEESGVPFYFIPGNHDIWGKGELFSRHALNELTKHPSCLIEKPIQLGEHVVIGDMGWFDYSLGEGHTNEEWLELKHRYWDARFTHFECDDLTLFGERYRLIKQQLDEHIDKPVVLVQHFVPGLDWVIRKNDPIWNVGNAFMGSKRLGNLINQYPNIKHMQFGHTHHVFNTIEKNGCQFHCYPLGYYGVEFFERDIELQLKDRSVILDL